jgi:hypothetical protein
MDKVGALSIYMVLGSVESCGDSLGKTASNDCSRCRTTIRYNITEGFSGHG